MYARPREKEFIIGHPALMLATFAFLRKWPTVIHFLLTIAGVIGIASMVETFCHIRTPVFMSIMRGYDGLLIGALLGLLLIIAVRFMMYVTQWFQARRLTMRVILLSLATMVLVMLVMKQCFVLLSMPFCKEEADAHITVISGNPYRDEQKHNIHVVGTFSAFGILKAISNSDLVISGGGSLLQDATSIRNTYYYLGIMAFSKNDG